MVAPAVSRDLSKAHRAGRRRSRPAIVAGATIAALAVLLILGVGLGTIRISPGETVGIIVWRTLGLETGATWSPAQEAIVWELRLPRVLTAMVVGASLGIAGATLQGLLRNPLADPFVLGTASGAALGAAVAIVLPISAAFVLVGTVTALAFLGALLAAIVVFRLGGGGGPGGLTRLLLTGYAVASILTALLTMAMYVSGSELRQIFSFLLGGLKHDNSLGITSSPLAMPRRSRGYYRRHPMAYERELERAWWRAGFEKNVEAGHFSRR